MLTVVFGTVHAGEVITTLSHYGVSALHVEGLWIGTLELEYGMDYEQMEIELGEWD